MLGPEIDHHIRSISFGGGMVIVYKNREDDWGFPDQLNTRLEPHKYFSDRARKRKEREINDMEEEEVRNCENLGALIFFLQVVLLPNKERLGSNGRGSPSFVFLGTTVTVLGFNHVLCAHTT